MTPLQDSRLLLLKAGSSLLASEDGAPRTGRFAVIARETAALAAQGKKVILVSSGAIALGRRALGTGRGRLRLNEAQAAAAIGQISLAVAWQQAFAPYHLPVAQNLLTLRDTEDRRSHINARATLLTLVGRGVIPVVNENDTVATAEIRFGDNDRLAARIAAMVSADVLLLLSDIDGLYDADPSVCPGAVRIPEVRSLTPEILAMAGASRSGGPGSGGMVTKLEAARICLQAGCHMAILNGHGPAPVSSLAGGAPCTWFLADRSPLSARKRWIAGSLAPTGSLVVDDGAASAMAAGRSLLPSGILDTGGQFGRGDTVRVCTRAGREIARGLVNYGFSEIREIMGQHTREIPGRLGYQGPGEIIHRDNLALL